MAEPFRKRRFMSKNKFIAALLIFACALIYTGRHVMLLAGMGIDTRFFFGLTWLFLLFTQAAILYVRFAERTDGAGKVSRWASRRWERLLSFLHARLLHGGSGRLTLCRSFRFRLACFPHLRWRY